MAGVEETPLPGVGVRYDFETAEGERLGVLVHRNGRRDLFVYSRDDPDACMATITFDSNDARTLAELFGAMQVAERLEAVAQDIAGLSIDWIRIDPDSEWAGMRLRDAAVHSQTGVSVVAIITAERAIAAPGAEDRLEPGATAVAVGTPEGLAGFAARLGRAEPV
jgi:TrkA domain protein